MYTQKAIEVKQNSFDIKADNELREKKRSQSTIKIYRYREMNKLNICFFPNNVQATELKIKAQKAKAHLG